MCSKRCVLLSEMPFKKFKNLKNSIILDPNVTTQPYIYLSKMHENCEKRNFFYTIAVFFWKHLLLSAQTFAFRYGENSKWVLKNTQKQENQFTDVLLIQDAYKVPHLNRKKTSNNFLKSILSLQGSKDFYGIFAVQKSAAVAAGAAGPVQGPERGPKIIRIKEKR